MEPVKATLSISLWCEIAAPTEGPKPGTTLTTPGGKPASLINWAQYKAVKGVCSAGFKITVLPKIKYFLYI